MNFTDLVAFRTPLQAILKNNTIIKQIFFISSRLIGFSLVTYSSINLVRIWYHFQCCLLQQNNVLHFSVAYIHLFYQMNHLDFVQHAFQNVQPRYCIYHLIFICFGLCIIMITVIFCICCFHRNNVFTISVLINIHQFFLCFYPHLNENFYMEKLGIVSTLTIFL